ALDRARARRPRARPPRRSLPRHPRRARHRRRRGSPSGSKQVRRETAEVGRPDVMAFGSMHSREAEQSSTRYFRSNEDLVKPDPIYGSILASKLINKLMSRGKKSTAQLIFYNAIDLAKKKLAEAEKGDIFVKAVENVKPMVEV